MNRFARKAAQIRAWIRSVDAPGDWPAGFVLAMFRTRPADPNAWLTRWIFPHVWLRPKLLHGLWLRMDPSRLSHFVIYEEIFMEGMYDLRRLTFEPDAIVDCGAFEGYFSLLARAHFASAPIIAFEPNADNFDGLIANVRANQLTIDARCAAVSTTDGEAAFEGHGCGGRLSAGGEAAVRVPVTDLRRVLKEMAPHRLLLKLDVEGEEATLLPELLPVLPQTCAIFFEWHHGEASYAAVADRLTTHGFATSRLRTNRVDDSTVFIDAFAQRS